MAEPGVLRLRTMRAAARHPQVVDALLGAALAIAVLLRMIIGHEERFGRDPALPDYLAAVGAFVVVALRRRWPLPVLAVAATSAVLCIAVGDTQPALIIATVIAAYTVATVSPRAVAWLSGGSVALVLYAASVRWSGHGWSEPENVGIFAWTGMAVAVGDALRTRRAYVAAVEERARRAEQSRDEEARRRVIEERLRIARELHDVVAHHIALINVQAGVAAHVMRHQPDQAELALAHVRQAARTVLDELGTVLGVLRQDGEPAVATEPTRGLSNLARLLDALAAAGLRVEYHRAGDARELPAAVDLAAYRIIQESLTNAKKHGSGGTAKLQLTYTDDGITVEVTNPAVGTNAGDAATIREGDGHDGTGHGLLGMQERATSVGGTLRAGPRLGETFRVYAVLPAHGYRGEPL